jgi:uncharacterized protein (TIGR03067 family)
MSKLLPSMCRPCMVLLTLVGLLWAPARADDHALMQGKWKATYWEVGDRVAAKDLVDQLALRIEGEALTLIEPGGKTETAHFVLIPNRTPAEIDVYKDSKKKVHIYRGIYAINGNELKLCWGPAGQPRPNNFSAKMRNDNRYFRFVKP